MKHKPTTIFIIVGAAVLLFGVLGTLGSVLNLFGKSITDFVQWDQQLPAQGFAPMVVPVDSYQDGTKAPTIVTSVTPDLAPTLVVTAEPAAGTPESQATPAAPQPTPTRVEVTPDRIVISAINLDAPIVPSKPSTAKIGGQVYDQWQAPNKFAVGWQTNSAVLGQPGNTVLNGHHNIEGKVFENLHLLQPGQIITLIGGQIKYNYEVVNVMILPERDMDVQTRLNNARWILPSTDERITLVTCWPATSNTHRLIVVAKPVGDAILLGGAVQN